MRNKKTGKQKRGGKNENIGRLKKSNNSWNKNLKS